MFGLTCRCRHHQGFSPSSCACSRRSARMMRDAASGCASCRIRISSSGLADSVRITVPMDLRTGGGGRQARQRVHVSAAIVEGPLDGYARKYLHEEASVGQRGRKQTPSVSVRSV